MPKQAITGAWLSNPPIYSKDNLEACLLLLQEQKCTESEHPNQYHRILKKQ